MVGSFNLDKWSWDNNHELNFCSKEKEHIKAFQQVYTKVLKDCDEVSKEKQPYKISKLIKVSFWQSFLWACNYLMNYRNIIKYEYRVMWMKKLYREKIIAGRSKRINFPEDKIRLYKGLNIEWDDAIGIEH